LFNHSDQPNVGYKLIDYDGRRVMAFYTLTNIDRDAQLYIDYNADVAVDVSQYKTNLVG
jgi:SET domain-containing protein